MSEQSSILIVVAILLLSISAFADDYSNSIDSEKDAIDKAIEYLGVDTTDAFIKTSKIAVKKEPEKDRLLIGLSGKDLSSTTQWLIEFSDLTFKYKHDASLRDYSVFIDSSTGELIEINSYSEKYGNLDTQEKLPLDEISNRLIRMNIQIKDSLCVEGMGLYDALRSCDWHPDNVLEISAYKYYGNSIFDRSIIPVWYVVMRGAVPALSSSAGKDMPESATNSILTVIGAITGQQLFTINLPHVDWSNKK